MSAALMLAVRSAPCIPYTAAIRKAAHLDVENQLLAAVVEFPIFVLARAAVIYAGIDVGIFTDGSVYFFFICLLLMLTLISMPLLRR